MSVIGLEQKEVASEENIGEQSGTPNIPHPSLEFPLFYRCIHRYQFLLTFSEKIYNLRWRILYLLQRRINCPFSKSLSISWLSVLGILSMGSVLLWGIISTFVYPSAVYSGHASRLPLLICYLTSSRNSIATFLLGLPFERAMKFHKLSGYIACLNGIFHTYVVIMMDQSYRDDVELLFYGQINISGTCLMIMIIFMMASAVPPLRRLAFELFYFVHILLAIAIVISAFYHSGVVVPICGSIFWGGDLVMRRVVMPLYWYPRRARIKSLSDDMVELSLPKTNFFYNPGQYVNIAIPELSIFQWHPFSISSSPFQDIVTIHIKRLGKWTGRLCDLAKEKSEVTFWLEGPYGSLSINLGGNRYEIVVLIGGGIGVTAMQSVALQLEREYNTGSRSMKRLYFVWTTRECDMIKGMQISNDTRTKNEFCLKTRNNVKHSNIPEQKKLRSSICSREGATQLFGGDSRCYSFGLEESSGELIDKEVQITRRKEEVLGLDIFVTSRENGNEDFDEIDIHQGRPDLGEIFTRIKQESIKRGEKRVAVCVCGNPALMNSVKRVCQILTDDQLSYDVHWTSFE